MTAKPLVHVIDDDDAVRDSIAFIMGVADIEAVTYTSAVAFLDRIADAGYGCVVTDVRMPEMSGLDLVQRLSQLGVTWPVIVITGHADVPLAVQAMKAGVKDFIEKPFDDDQLIAAVRRALEGTEQKVRDEAEHKLVLERIAGLSGREQEVLDGLVAGHANKVIAYDLGISPRTVEVYRANVMSKMQAASLSDLVRMTLLARRPT